MYRLLAGLCLFTPFVITDAAQAQTAPAFCPYGQIADKQTCRAMLPAELKALQARQSAEVRRAVSRSQTRLSETAPPQAPNGDATLRDPTTRQYLRREISTVHP